MKKTIFMTILGLVSALVMTGCGGSSSTQDYVEDIKEISFLVDQDGYSVSGIDYDCVSGGGTTANDGSFFFYPGERCTFYLDLPTVDSTIDILHLEDTVGGLVDVEYICENGDFGYTNDLGRFNFDNLYADDECDFFL